MSNQTRPTFALLPFFAFFSVFGIDIIMLSLFWIGLMSIVWMVVHGYYLARQWRQKRIRPGVLGGGLWVMFAALATVCAAGVTRRFVPDWTVLMAIIDVAIVGVAVATTWLVAQLFRMRA